MGESFIRFENVKKVYRSGEVEVTAGCGKVELRRYIADAELVKTILEASADSGETDTAKWMTGAAKEAGR